ncbi:hypothetical protein E8E15_002528 [Penicillium rubens]|jgi:hypothetical protein|uniref:uncharacterized protein n=1 Tax=Penicillium rubens TaxID=1108849 RepID=UPI001DB2434E|nr:uncharacterized protein N7525_008924 [Penicillium rubens]KAF3023218.1 hypothetical protein E8E15_002528 [Penicillium rubens]KAJ5830671.1 hypothetical protein N7525_008924 [Penicillium rubens]KAJ5854251.1 hypothetical protein N7534_006794 [Penicillium rubens]
MVYVVKGSALVLSDGTDTETTITLRPYTEGTRGSSMIFGMSPCLLMDIKTRMDRALYWAVAGLSQPETTGSSVNYLLPTVKTSRPPRNVNFYDGLTGAHLGGVRQNGSITNANFFHKLMDVLLKVDGISIHHRGTGQRMPMNTDRLAEGDYDIVCP